MDRRKFITASSTLAAAFTYPAIAKISYPIMNSPVKAILFDGFSIFDPRSVFKMAMEFYPEKGNELIKEWRTRQFEYTWLRSMTGNYQDFFTITEEALVFTTMLLGLNMSDLHRRALMSAYYQLQTWPEVPTALSRLKAVGYQLGILSNFTPEMLAVNSANGRIGNYFEHLISVDTVKRYKPDPVTYSMGMSAFKLSKKEILFVPFAGWDAAGAKAFGYQTFWANGMLAPQEQLGSAPDGTGKNLNDLLSFLNI